MKTRMFALMTMIALLAAPVGAQERTTETAAWQSLAATLVPGAFVEVWTKDGAHFKGTFVQRLDDRLVVKPHTRIPVPAQEVAFGDLESIAPAKRGMNPATKVLIGVGIGLGGILLIGLAALASAY